MNQRNKCGKTSARRANLVGDGRLWARACRVPGGSFRARVAIGIFCLGLLVGARVSAAESMATTRPTTQPRGEGASLEEMRLATDKWIETQQIIFKERKEWQQGKEILEGRTELVEKEISNLEEKLKQVASATSDAKKQNEELVTENEELKATFGELTKSVGAMEAEVRRMSKMLPEPTRVKLAPLYQRIPDDSAKTRAAVAERYQNVLGILNEVNKTNSEIFANYEVHTLAGGKSVEVQAIYIGLAQAYYVSAAGEAGICHPTVDGWKWEPRNSISREVQRVLEILQGKETAAFVPLPVRIQ